MSLLVPSSRGGRLAAILVGTLLLASATILVLAVRGQGPPPKTLHVAFRYGGVLCSLKGCLLQTVSELCRADGVEELRMRVEGVSADYTGAVILVTYRARPGAEGRLERIAGEPFRPLGTEPWVGPLPDWSSDWCRLST